MTKPFGLEICLRKQVMGGLKKWLNSRIPDGCSVHSFRHSMRDRLRAVNCPFEMVDQIGGWSRETVGQGYGLGYDLEKVQQVMKAIT